jgi:hypothetical protein
MHVEDEFYIGKNPRFYCRKGPDYEGPACSQNKLCFTSTDRELLKRHLFQLSQRVDCYFVKFSIEPRGGLYLGRCFLRTDRAVGRVWAQYKCHPTLFCTVQNDDFVHEYRDLSDHYDSIWIDSDGVNGDDPPWKVCPADLA